MMRLLPAIVLIALLSFVARQWLPWWSIAPVSVLVCFGFKLSAARGFLAGFVGVWLFWFAIAWLRDWRNEHMLSARMAELFQLPGSMVFLLLGSLVGALVGGLAGWSGALLRRAVQR